MIVSTDGQTQKRACNSHCAPKVRLPVLEHHGFCVQYGCQCSQSLSGLESQSYLPFKQIGVDGVLLQSPYNEAMQFITCRTKNSIVQLAPDKGRVCDDAFAIAQAVQKWYIIVQCEGEHPGPCKPCQNGSGIKSGMLIGILLHCGGPGEGCHLPCYDGLQPLRNSFEARPRTRHLRPAAPDELRSGGRHGGWARDGWPLTRQNLPAYVERLQPAPRRPPSHELQQQKAESVHIGSGRAGRAGVGQHLVSAASQSSTYSGKPNWVFVRACNPRGRLPQAIVPITNMQGQRHRPPYCPATNRA
jgi:hypothetical protein